MRTPRVHFASVLKFASLSLLSCVFGAYVRDIRVGTPFRCTACTNAIVGIVVVVNRPSRRAGSFFLLGLPSFHRLPSTVCCLCSLPPSNRVSCLQRNVKTMNGMYTLQQKRSRTEHPCLKLEHPQLDQDLVILITHPGSRSAVAPPQLFFNEIGGFKTSSRSYLLKYVVPRHPDAIDRQTFALKKIYQVWILWFQYYPSLYRAAMKRPSNQIAGFGGGAIVEFVLGRECFCSLRQLHRPYRPLCMCVCPTTIP